jgi:drug/metabolite transporter (DMT)-like permease
MSQLRLYKNVQGIIFMLINSVSISVLYGINKYLTQFISSNQVVFLYKLVVLLAVIPWVLYGGVECIKTKKLKLHLLRGIVSTFGALLFFYGMSKVDIASATALNKMEPVLLMLVGAFYFKEKLSLSKITTVLVSCVGMLFVVYPIVTFTGEGLQLPWLHSQNEAPEFNYNYLIILGAVLLWTLNSGVVKTLGKTESNRTQLFYVSLISVLVSMPAALFKWEIQPVIGINMPWIAEAASFTNFSSLYIMLILLMGVLHFSHVSFYFLSLKVGEMSVVIPFDYSRLVFGGIASWWVFDSAPSFSSYIGYFLILSSGLYLLKTQATAKKGA